VCLLSSHGQAITVRKNCEPFVLGPRLAIAKQYGRSNLCF
jgi:hypothetical protein